MCILISGCNYSSVYDPRIRVTLVQSNDYYIEENGLLIYPGQDVTFTVQVYSGRELMGVDYDGTYRIWQENGKTKIKLEDVNYPTRVELLITSHYRRITYDPNGGSGSVTTLTYNTELHTRPNTSIGANLFSRKGYTLIGWNTAADGSGSRVGLGSRVSVDITGLTLYAQWAKWADEDDFTWSATDSQVTITGYHGSGDTVCIPETIQGLPVTTIASGAFNNAPTQTLILPHSIVTLEDGAVSTADLRELVFFDNIENISDRAFSGCTELTTLYINAIEAPFGYSFRRESMYADKIDMLIDAQGQKKAVFYGGCSMWYNLDGEAAQNALKDYIVVNTALNGTINSYVQMQIMAHYLEEGDIFFHTPELTSPQQLLTDLTMDSGDDYLWCGLEYNYDLLTLVDIRPIDGLFDSLRHYLDRKNEETAYTGQYLDADSNRYLDATGSLPFRRDVPTEDLPEIETVALDLVAIQNSDLSMLKAMYDRYTELGVHVYVSYYCIMYDEVPEDQRDNADPIHRYFKSALEEMDGPVLVSKIWDYLYQRADFYNTAYHLLSSAVESNTALWLRDLRAQMAKDGL